MTYDKAGSKALKTRVTDLLGIEHPVILGGMAWITGWEMAVAVSEAGGLGTLAAGTMEPEDLTAHIRRVREETQRPFAVNIPLRLPTSQRAIEIAIEEQAPVVIFSAGNPGRYAGLVKEKGIKLLQVVFNLDMVRRSNEAGVDAVIAMGAEGGGNISSAEVSTFVLVREAAEATDLPVIAAGGIVDAKGLVAALALGAEGVQMGTRFLASREGTLHDNYKQAVLNAKCSDTVVTGRSTGIQFRVLKNDLAGEILKLEREGKGRDEIDRLTIGSLQRAAVEGDLERGSFMMGQGAGLVHEVKSIKEIIDDLISESIREINSLGRWVQ